jgi:hypothetical protein
MAPSAPAQRPARGKHSLGVRTTLRALPVVAVLVVALTAAASLPPSQASGGQLTMTARTELGLFPKYNPLVRDYAMFNCHGRNVTVNFNRAVKLDGASTRSWNINAVRDTAVRFTVSDSGGRPTVHTLRCLRDGFPKLSFTKKDRSVNGLVVLGVPIGQGQQSKSFITIFVANGVPLWYRSAGQATGMSVPVVNADGTMVLLMRQMNPRPGAVELETNRLNHLVRLDLTGALFEKVRATAKGKVVPLDYHGFAQTKRGYFFISSKVTTVKALSQGMIENSNLNAEDAAKYKVCLSATKHKEVSAVIVRTDKTGVVNWTYEMKGVEPTNQRGFVRWVGEENGVLTCYFEIHHPNWVSVDPSGKQIYVSLLATGKNYAVDIATKKVVWRIGTSGDDTLRTVNDPLGHPQNMHSGSMNANGEFIVFDNRMDMSETGRAVIYALNKGVRATFVRQFLPPRDKCTTSAGQIYCPTRVMGNASFTADGKVLVNWGDKNGNPNVVTLFDRSGVVLLDVRDESRRTITYKSEYVSNTLPSGRTWITLDMVVNGTNSNNVEMLEPKFNAK